MKKIAILILLSLSGCALAGDGNDGDLLDKSSAEVERRTSSPVGPIGTTPPVGDQPQWCDHDPENGVSWCCTQSGTVTCCCSTFYCQCTWQPPVLTP